MIGKFLTYEMFGAIGDGIHDDMDAIVACHAEANKTNTPVKTKDGAKYKVGRRAITAVIKTDVDFGKSEFIFDDTDVEDINCYIFSIESDYEKYSLDIASLDRDSIINLPHEGEAFVHIYDDSCKRYIRKGLNQNAGEASSDVFIVGADGKIKTDINWSYPTVSRCKARRIDERKITVSGGIFTTIANQAESFYNYFHRGFSITRDNVTVCGFTHKIVGEGTQGAPYDGFFNVCECADVTIDNCLLTPHFTYRTQSVGDPTKMVSMGTYDIILTATIRTTLSHITQTIDIMNTSYWGLMGSNYCKEMTLSDCVISRFDAHMGVTNAKIVRCKLGHQCLNLIGFGTFLLEDSTLFGKHVIGLRSDYGSSWCGSIKIKNCKWKPMVHKACVIEANNDATHNFGYTCYMPSSIEIDGLTVLDGEFNLNGERLFYLPNYDKAYTADKPYKYITTERLTVSNIVAESGREIELCENSLLYDGISFCKN